MTNSPDPMIIGTSRTHEPQSADDHREVRRTFRLPDLGEGLTEAEIVAWRVAEGDEVGVDDVVVDVETAKATVEVPCPHAGRVLRLHARDGELVRVGEPLITVEALFSGEAGNVPVEALPSGEAGNMPVEALPSGEAGNMPVEPHPSGEAGNVPVEPRISGGGEEAAGSGAVLVGYGTGQATLERRSRSRGRTAPPGAPRVLSPVVRRLARDRGVDVRRLTGSGPDGVIVRRDVEAASEASPATATGQRETLRGIRRVVAEKLSRSRREIPDATTWVDVDATALVEARDALRAAAPDRPVGLLALLGRITVAALAKFPDLNASIERNGDDLVLVRHDGVGLGFAAQTDRGLVVPVVHGADRMSTAALAAEFTRLTGLARDGGLAPEQLTGGTFTLNNYGVFGVDGSTPIINHPDAALLGVGRIVDKPWVVDGQLAVRKVTQLSLTFDHRVCDGGVAGGFLRYVADRVESPVGLLLDL